MLIDNSTKENPVRIYTDGCFDCFHIGHANLLKQCKLKFQYVYLMVGVSQNEDIEKFKGACIQSDFERIELIQHIKWVDQVISPCPWQIDLEFINKHKIDYVMHDDVPYSCNDIEDIYLPIKKIGKFIPTQRTEGISTSDLAFRIITNKDSYIKKLLKKGYTFQQLNLNLFEEIIYGLNLQKYFNCSKRKTL